MVKLILVLSSSKCYEENKAILVQSCERRAVLAYEWSEPAFHEIQCLQAKGLNEVRDI